MTLRSLRLRLTLLYMLVSLALIVLLGAGTYWLLAHYFETSTDRALEHRMAQQFRSLGATLPPGLLAADQAWYEGVSTTSPAARRETGENRRARSGEDERESHDDHERREEPKREDSYDSELAGIFVLPLSTDGSLLASPGTATPPLSPNLDAVTVALARGSDWRTAHLPDGTRVRLLTYRVPDGRGPAALQLGRTVGEQDRLLAQLVMALLGLGVFSSAAMGGVSWWLAGRSIRPVQMAWEQQRTFVANAGHELRAPLTLIRASAEVARRGHVDDDRRALLDDVLTECDHVSRLVEDLLLLSRLDADRLAIERKVVGLGHLLADLERQVGRLAAERQIRLTSSGGRAAWGDPTRLRQVLLILLDNALRHTSPGGSIRLEARQEGGRAMLVVSDTGSGIDPKHLPHVFERFYRVDGARDDGGSGLGLSIAKALVEAQGGEIRLESEVGRGTTVAVALPAARPGRQAHDERHGRARFAR